MDIEVYTDGSYKKTGKKEYCGYGIYFPNHEYKNISRRFTHAPITNNRAELYAILKTIILCNIINKKERVKSVTIYSDSEYSVKTINIWYKKWKPSDKKLNLDIIDEIMKMKKESNFDIILKHINSHTGNKDKHSINNDEADKLAKEGAHRED